MKLLGFFAIVFFSLSVPASAAMDSASFTPQETINPSSGGGVPVGTVIAWPGAANPKDADKWLDCNGQAISQAAYPKLYAIVGANVPDYRGMFLRGYGSQTHAKNNGSLVGNTFTIHSSGALGQIQGDAIRNLSGRVVADSSRSGSSPTGPFYNSGEVWNNHTDTGRSGIVYFNAALVTPTANEIRPVNKAVRYLIRAKD